MFYELIYTRCRQGLDIMRKGQALSSDGYKVYSCTHALMEEGKLDLPFFVNATQAKQSYTDPGFMDDAYLFYVPDSGESFFVDFHPIHFDPNTPGDYAHRPGNFLNHALVGDFSGIYPYQMFQDDGIWSAKVKGEAYYYENEPAPLPERDIANLGGRYKFEDIGAFIADGRQEALQKAVAFLIAQYNVEPEQRKYLVIKDDSSENIEKWIAAIECAFSPQMASVIPFATRMDKFANLNRYTVKNGIYQSQMNLQDPNQKQRYRAMIVGVDERDKANVNSARPLANSPFVLLDGKQKQAPFEANTSAGYYQAIIRFDDNHKKFCQKFLPTFPAVKPNAEICELYEMFSVLTGTEMPPAQTLANNLAKLGKYQAKVTAIYSEIYNKVKEKAPQCMQEDFSIALDILSWLQKASTVVNDATLKDWATGEVCNAFTGIVFGKTDNAKKLAYWAQIRRTEFAPDVARTIADTKVINTDNADNIRAFAPADVETFVDIYIDAATLARCIDDKKDLIKIVRFGSIVCYKERDSNALSKIISVLSRKGINTQEVLFAVIKILDDPKTAVVINFILDNMIGNKLPEMERFIKKIKTIPSIDEGVVVNIFETVDAKLNMATDGTSPLVELLQSSQRPSAAKCSKSAHLLALNILSSRGKQNIADVFEKLKGQDFPSITDAEYTGTLFEHLIKAKLSEGELLPLFEILFSDETKGYFSAFADKLISQAGKNKDKWNALITYVSGEKNKQGYDDTLIQVLVNSKQKGLFGGDQRAKLADELSNLLNDKNFKYFDSTIAVKAKEDIAAEKQKKG